MSYIQSILEPGEQVRYHTTISWTIYTPAILLAICALALAALAGSHAHMVGLAWLATPSPSPSQLQSRDVCARLVSPLDDRNRRHRSPHHPQARLDTPAYSRNEYAEG